VFLPPICWHARALLRTQGSQQWGLLEDCGFFQHSGEEGTLSLAQQVDACLAAAPPGARWEPVDAVLPPGGCSLHDNFTLHGSGPNLSDTYRRSLVSC
jgi:hypothetical protein